MAKLDNLKPTGIQVPPTEGSGEYYIEDKEYPMFVAIVAEDNIISKENRFFPFTIKVKDKKLSPNLEAPTIYQIKEYYPQNEVFEYTGSLFERIRSFLKEYENPEELFKPESPRDDIKTKCLKRAKLLSDRAHEAEDCYHNSPDDRNYWTNDKKIKDIRTAHRAICLIELPDFLSEYREIEEMEKGFKEKFGDKWLLKAHNDEKYNYYKNKLKSLHDKAEAHYNKINGKLEIK